MLWDFKPNEMHHDRMFVQTLHGGLIGYNCLILQGHLRKIGLNEFNEMILSLQSARDRRKQQASPR